MINIRKKISTILAEANELPTVADRALHLRNNDSDALRLALKLAFDQNIVFDLPEGAPPYKSDSEAFGNEGVLYKEIFDLHYYIEGAYKYTIPKGAWQLKRNGMFIRLLESLPASDAELVLHIKDKRLPYKNISLAVVEKAFPDLPIEKKKKAKAD